MAPRVLVTRRIPDAGLKLVLDATDADLWEDEMPPPRDELLRRVAGVEGLLSLLTDRVDDELLDAAGGQLKVISNFAVGFDNIDVPACTRRGIPVGNTPGVLTETTADLAFALLMAVARRLTEAARLGFTIALVPLGCSEGAPAGMKVIEVGDLAGALHVATRSARAS